MILINEYQKEIIRELLRRPKTFKEEDYPAEDIETIKRFLKDMLAKLEERDIKLKEMGMK